jgi:tyrosinase
MGCRKNLTRLTLSERQAFVNAVLQLKANGGYDRYPTMHQGGLNHGHFGPAFFPWHRELLRRFELELQAIDSSVNIPYWDWTVGNLNAAGTESLIWRDDFMGGPGSGANFAVATGPFTGPAWNLRRNRFDIFQFPGGGGTIAAFVDELDYTLMRGLESPHGAAHSWVGGTVGDIAFAPRDPVFWLIHCNIDRLWAEWTVAKSGQAGWVQYAPASGGPTGHNLNDSMWPWNGGTSPFGILPWTTVPDSVRPADLLDHRALNTLYDTIDPPCRAIKPKDRLPKEFIKERLPKEFIKDRLPKEFKERLPKELIKDKERVKERLPKELIKDRAPKELGKDRDPKELKDVREGPKRFAREEIGPFIPEELRPDLTQAALGFEPDLAELQEELMLRAEELRGGGPF